jgi:hypothetical protein
LAGRIIDDRDLSAGDDGAGGVGYCAQDLSLALRNPILKLSNDEEEQEYERFYDFVEFQIGLPVRVLERLSSRDEIISKSDTVLVGRREMRTDRYSS